LGRILDRRDDVIVFAGAAQIAAAAVLEILRAVRSELGFG
jgi:hypothetical protein